MGNLVYYLDDRHELGEISLGRWQEARKLLPALIEFVNDSMELDWSGDSFQNVSVFANGTVQPPLQPKREPPSPGTPFDVERLIRDHSDLSNEIYLCEAAQWMRLLAWYDFVATRDGAADLYRPLVGLLRSISRGIEQFA